MSKAFGYPSYSSDGVQQLTAVTGEYSDALMDTAVHRLRAGETRTFRYPDAESAYLLIEGCIVVQWEKETAQLSRTTCFDNGAEVAGLHVCRGVSVTVSAETDAELFVVFTENEARFPAEFYPTDKIRSVVSCADLCGGTCERTVTTLFDDQTAPLSHLVLGETYPLPGKWCGYPPHSHPQPEVYYYRVDRPEGFGFCCVGDEVFPI